MKYRALKYIAKVWVTSAFITPIVITPVYYTLRQIIDLSDGLPGAPVQSFWSSDFYLFIMVLLGSLIPWLMTLTFAKPIICSLRSALVKKLILGAAPMILFTLIFLIGGAAEHFKGWRLVFEGWLSYTIAVALSLWFYRIDLKNPINTLTETANSPL